MLDEANQLLGIAPDADAQTIERAYWRIVRELSQLRRQEPEVANQLDQINWAYKALIDERRQRPARAWKEQRRSLPWRKLSSAAVAATFAVVAVSVGFNYQGEIHDQASRGADQAKESWGETITWLQTIGHEKIETVTPPGDAVSRHDTTE